MARLKEVVIIGAGAKIAGPHAKALSDGFKNPCATGFRLAFCSSNPEVLDGLLSSENNLDIEILKPGKRLTRHFMRGVRKYSTPEEVIANASKIGYVVICYPTSRHMEMAKMFLEAGIPVLIEKPYGLFPAEVSEFRASSRADVKYAVAHNLPGFRAYMALTAALLSRKYGAVQSIEMTRFVRSGNEINVPANAALYRNAFFDLAVHDIHFVLWRFGLPVSVQLMEASWHSDDNTFLSRAKVRLNYYWGDVIIDAGANSKVAKFHHSFGVITDSGVNLAMDSILTNWVAKSLEGGVTLELPVPEFYENYPADTAPFNLVHDVFCGRIENDDQLNEQCAFRAVQLADWVVRESGKIPSGWTVTKFGQVFAA